VTPDLDPNDLDEVMRRVVDPVLSALLREDEIDSVEVRAEPGGRWREEGTWVSMTLRGEFFEIWLCSPGPRPESAELAALHLYDVLQDEIAESRFGWGELRGGDYVVPPPA
jgi:hypothetical protein